MRTATKALAGATACCLVGACSKSASPARVTPPHSTSIHTAKTTANTPANGPSGKAEADHAAGRLLARTVLPPGAQRLATTPNGAPAGPYTSHTGSYFVDRGALWKVSLAADALWTFVTSHPPQGLVASGTGRATQNGRPVFRAVTFGAPVGVTGPGELQVTVSAAGPHTAWLRADAQVTWSPARPSNEYAPTGGAVTISISTGKTRRVTDPPTVLRLADDFNSLTVDTGGPSAGVNGTCLGTEPTLSVAFTRRGETNPVLTATTGGCSFGYDVRGPAGTLPSLVGPDSLTTDALRVLGLPKTALSAPRAASSNRG